MPNTSRKSNSDRDISSYLNLKSNMRIKRGDVISIILRNGQKVAIGISAYDFSDAKKIIGKNSKEISKILGFEGRDEVVHKDNLVRFSS